MTYMYNVYVAKAVLALCILQVLGVCSFGCISCDDDKTCTSCQTSYYLYSGNCLPCPENCATCDNYNECTSCKPHKWGLTAECSYTCSTYCRNNECQDDNGYCTGCLTGTYGQQCQHNCSLCQDGQCDLRKCTLGCKSEYFEYHTSTETLCYKCPSDCKLCNCSHLCNVCNDEFYLYEFMSGGKIYVYCVSCPLTKSCKTCQVQSDYVICTACYDGFELSGESCKQQVSNESSCFSGCSTNCDENGACLGSCNVGRTGEKCTEQCQNQCLRCDKKNANICEECNGDFYTATCNVHCSSLCVEVPGQATCRIQDGYCLNNCEKRLWGSFCSMPCSNRCFDDGLSHVCERDTGTCKHGCINGYSGDMCETTMSSEHREEKTRSFSQTHLSATSSIKISDHRQECSFKMVFITGYFSGIGTCLVFAAVFTVLHVLRRRYFAKESKTNREMTTNSDETTDQTLQGRHVSETTMSEINTYESLGNRRNHDTVYTELARPSIQQD